MEELPPNLSATSGMSLSLFHLIFWEEEKSRLFNPSGSHIVCLETSLSSSQWGAVFCVTNLLVYDEHPKRSTDAFQGTSVEKQGS